MKSTILCVDDENIVLSSLKEQLKREFGIQYRIEVADSAESALEILDEYQDSGGEISFIISDQIMPGMKGDEFLIQAHKKYPEALKVLLTGQADAQAVGNALNHANLYRYIPKPWDSIDLNMTISEGLRRYHQDKEIAEKNQTLLDNATAFYKFVPIQFLNMLGFNETSYSSIQLGESIEKELTVLFVDIRSFTSLCEIIPSGEIFYFLNEYLSFMTPIIHNNNGFIDKYIGDSIMALFQNPDDAISACLGMYSSLKEFNKKRAESGSIPIAVGWGVNTGKIILGTLGDVSRMQTTVIGDAVNIAARVEALTKDLRYPILVTEETILKLKNPSKFQLSELPVSDIRGKLNGSKLYTINV